MVQFPGDQEQLTALGVAISWSAPLPTSSGARVSSGWMEGPPAMTGGFAVSMCSE